MNSWMKASGKFSAIFKNANIESTLSLMVKNCNISYNGIKFCREYLNNTLTAIFAN